MASMTFIIMLKQICDVFPLQLYRKQATEMGYDECHYFLRFVQFEFANFKQDAGKPPPVFIQSIQEDDSGIDRYEEFKFNVFIVCQEGWTIMTGIFMRHWLDFYHSS